MDETDPLPPRPRRPGLFEFLDSIGGNDELRDALWRARQKRERARLAVTEARAALYFAVSEAEGRIPVSDIARLAGISRRAVYDLFEQFDLDQG